MVRAGRYMELEAKGKRSRASSDILAGDRLSALPDCIIHHIMSFMKARQVVQTCVLSTRWTNLWRSVLCLDVDEEEFRNQGRDYTMDEELEKFEDFTDHLLIPNNISISSLDMFRLHVTDRYRSGKQSAKWIRHGVKYSTRAPDIQVKGLSSNSWRIKRLHLSNVHLDDNFTKHVSSGCPYLECLELKGCWCTFHDITSHSLENLILISCSCSVFSEIKSSTLKNLVIDNCVRACYNPLIITAPAVAYLFLALNRDQFEVAGGVSIDEMPFLVKASVDLQGILCKNQTKLLGSFSNVTSLELLRFPAKVLSEESVTAPEFTDLRSLLLDRCDFSVNFKILEHFLSIHLIWRRSLFGVAGSQIAFGEWMEWRHLPPKVSSVLKSYIKMKIFANWSSSCQAIKGVYQKIA